MKLTEFLLFYLFQMNTRNDCEVFIFGIKQEKSEINYKFIDKTELFVSSESETSEFKTKWEGTLEKGVYVLIPSTTGCLFRKRKNQPSSDIHLTSIESESEEIILTEKYQKAIIEIFHQLDLDDNDTLSRAEFNLYNWRTSSMELTVSHLTFLLFRHVILLIFVNLLRTRPQKFRKQTL